MMPKTRFGALRRVLPLGCAVLAFFIFSIFFVIIDANRVGHLKRVYLADSMAPGQIIAFDGQKGPQLTVLRPGRYCINQYLFSVKLNNATDIPAGFVGVIKCNVQESPEWELAPIP